MKGFSVYARSKNVDVDIPLGTTCLAGANGLGKSTFLAAVTFGLTGSVPNPDGPQSRNLSEYRRDAIAYSRDYFTGRINERDHDRASVALELELGQNRIRIERPIFRPKPELSHFGVSLAGTRSRIIIPQSRTTTGTTRLSAFESFVTAQVGLESFDQFVFLHHFVLTFDERRHLLFWDNRAAEQALFLIFGGNREAAQADKFRRLAERADSRARNLQYDATKLQQRIDDLQSAFGLAEPGNNDEDLLRSVRALLDQESELESKLELKESSLSEAVLKVADSAAAVVSLRDEYDRRFQQLLAGHADPTSNPLVRSSIQDELCGICGTSGEAIVEQIQSRLKRNHCPLCNSMLHQRQDNASFTELANIDTQLAAAQDKYELAARAKRRVEEDRDSAAAQYLSVQAKIAKLEKSNRELIASIRRKGTTAGSDPDQISLGALRADLQTILAEKATALRERDARRMDLAGLQATLTARYAAAEIHFLPIFRSLAEMFLGRQVTVRLRKATAGLSLLIDVDKSQRRQQHQLSESQRFFVDLALRMALAQFMSAPKALAPLYVDTPEGALDITYEKQAGAMFARFVRSGHTLIMTANVNSSQLLLELARQCGRKLFNLIVMTEWSELSLVQRSGEALFKASIRSIKAAISRNA